MEEATNFQVDIFVWTGCGFGFFVMYFGFSSSSALLVVISVEKCFALYFPFKTKTVCTVGTARRVSLVTVLIFVGFNLQFLFIGKKFEDEFGAYCSYGNVSEFYVDLLFGVVSAILNSYGPFVIMILCNCAIVYKFMMVKWKNRRGNTESTSQALSKSATTGTAMLLTVSFTFIFLTAPIWAANAVWPDSIPVIIFKTCLAFQYLNHGINGILYCVIGSRFRNELKNLFRCGKTDSKCSQRLCTKNSTVRNETTGVPST